MGIIVLEKWLNQTLREAEYFSIPGALRRNIVPQDDSISFDYGIDRMTL